MASTPLKRSNVLGVEFVAEGFDTVIQSAVELLRSDERAARYLCPSGVHGIIEAQKDPAFRQILNQAEFNIADGKPVVFASRLAGFRDSERAFGPDAMWAILRESVPLGCSHFFYGGREGVADMLAERVQQAFPGLRVAGTYCPPFRALSLAEENEIASVINRSGADVVWVGLSTPKQERWIAAMRHRLGVKLICSVGAAFDYHTGSIDPAPKWMQKAALEWLFRIIQEPRRLWRRYVEIVPTFLFLIALQLLRLKKFRVDR